jgi:hypothetical protein
MRNFSLGLGCHASPDYRLGRAAARGIHRPQEGIPPFDWLGDRSNEVASLCRMMKAAAPAVCD